MLVVFLFESIADGKTSSKNSFLEPKKNCSIVVRILFLLVFFKFKKSFFFHKMSHYFECLNVSNSGHHSIIPVIFRCS